MKSLQINFADRAELDAPAAKVLAYLSDLNHIREYEPKISLVKVSAKTPRTGLLYASGFFGLIPWMGKFSYTRTKSGFYSEMLSPAMGLKVNGGFAVQPVNGHCRVVHFENYELPALLLPIVPLFKRYMRWSMRKEMANLAGRVGNKASASAA